MTNWKENGYPFKKFTEELTREWIKKGFDKKETREWLESGLQSNDAGWAQWLRDIKKVKAKWVLNEGDEEGLREQYAKYLESGDYINDWRDIHSEFTTELQAKWEKSGFDYHQTKDWVNIGLKLEEDDFARWLKEQQKSPEWCLNYGNVEKSRKEYSDYVKKLFLNRGITYENIQQWLDKKYPNKEKIEWIDRQVSRGFDRIGNRREIDSSYENELAGKLVIKDFPNLEKIYLDLDDDEFYNYEGKLTDLEVVNCPNLTELWCQYNQLSRLFLNNCLNLNKLICAGNQLATLDLTNLTNLKELACGDNQLIKLGLGSNNQLETVICHKNKLESIELPNDPEKLTRLTLSDNNFSSQTLDFLKKYTSLTVLQIDNSNKHEKKFDKENNKKIDGDKVNYNRFYGSLEFLRNMFWLTHLDISDTDIDLGLEYLPTENLKQFLCYAKSRPQAKVVQLAQICDGGEIDSRFNKETLINAQLAIVKEKGIDISKLREKENNDSKRKTPQQWLKELGIKLDLDRVTKLQDAQQWLDKKYPNKKEVRKINFLDYDSQSQPMNWHQKDIIGELILKDFPNLNEINIGFAGYLKKLEIVNCPKLASISCQGNRILTHLDLSKFNQLINIDVADNRLVFIKLPIETKKLTSLIINGNNFSAQTLDFLTPYTNLETIDIGSSADVDYEKANLEEGRYNRFYGSLEPLKNMTKLDFLSIRNTDVDSGLEYLPLNSLKRFSCSANLRIEAKVAKIHTICGTDIFGYGLDKKVLKKYQADFQQKKEVEKQAKQKASSQSQNQQLKNYQEISQKIIHQLKEENRNLQEELTAKKTNNAGLQKEHSFYKQFFDKYLQAKKSEIDQLKSRLSNKEWEWLDIYCEANQEAEKSSFVKKQLKRAKENLKEKFSEEELELVLEKQTEINKLESQLNSLQIQEAQIEIPFC